MLPEPVWAAPQRFRIVFGRGDELGAKLFPLLDGENGHAGNLKRFAREAGSEGLKQVPHRSFRPIRNDKVLLVTNVFLKTGSE